jgi:endonuclease-3
MASVDWKAALKPLIEKYRGRKHPLDYGNTYQLLVMVLLSARDSDKHINQLAPALFAQFPTMAELAKASFDELAPLIGSVSNFKTKAEWLTGIAQTLKTDEAIPLTMEGLVALKGLGRKSANVIMSQSGAPAEGVIVDLHTLRVAPRIGIAQGTTSEKIEKQLMEKVDAQDWHALGLALTFLGRETCRPTNPRCPECPMNDVCAYRKTLPPF